MKKILIALTSLVFLGAGCLSTTQVSEPNQSSTPASTSQNLKYKDDTRGFEISYPDNAQIRNDTTSGFLQLTKNAAVGIYLPQSMFAATNLGEAAVIVGYDNSADVVNKCDKPINQEQDKGLADFNGSQFHEFDGIGAAAGNTYESRSFRALKNQTCFEVVEMLHYGNIYNYPTGSVQEFDKAKFNSLLDQIARTFKFTK